MLYYLNRFLGYFIYFPKIIYLKLSGISVAWATKIKPYAKIKGFIKICPGVFIGQYCQILGNIHIDELSKLENNTSLEGDIKVGKRCVIKTNVHIKGNVILGDDVIIHENTFIMGNIQIGSNSSVGRFTNLSTLQIGYLNIGKDVLINDYSTIGSMESVTIDDHCIFAPFLQITDASHNIDQIDVLIKHAPIDTNPVHIKKNVWLGNGVMIAKGVVIGENSVVGAKSFVNLSFPANSVIYGIPAKKIRDRI